METKVKWPGHIIDIDFEFDEATIAYLINDCVYELTLDLEDIPKDLHHLGQMCRIIGDTIEWCRDVWTQEELDAAREKGKELDELFNMDSDDEQKKP